MSQSRNGITAIQEFRQLVADERQQFRQSDRWLLLSENVFKVGGFSGLRARVSAATIIKQQLFRAAFQFFGVKIICIYLFWLFSFINFKKVKANYVWASLRGFVDVTLFKKKLFWIFFGHKQKLKLYTHLVLHPPHTPGLRKTTGCNLFETTFNWTNGKITIKCNDKIYVANLTV